MHFWFVNCRQPLTEFLLGLRVDHRWLVSFTLQQAALKNFNFESWGRLVARWAFAFPLWANHSHDQRFTVPFSRLCSKSYTGGTRVASRILGLSHRTLMFVHALSKFVRWWIASPRRCIWHTSCSTTVPESPFIELQTRYLFPIFFCAPALLLFLYRNLDTCTRKQFTFLSYKPSSSLSFKYLP